MYMILNLVIYCLEEKEDTILNGMRDTNWTWHKKVIQPLKIPLVLPGEMAEGFTLAGAMIQALKIIGGWKA